MAANFVISADGSARKPGPAYRHFSGPVDRRSFRRLRIHFDAILRGARTLEINPIRDLANPAIRRALDERGRRMPVVVAVSNSGQIPDEAGLIRGADPQLPPILCVPENAKVSATVARACRVWRFSGPRLDLARVLERLGRQCGVQRVLCEGGPTLLRGLLDRGLLDELLLTIAPCLLGDPDKLTLLGGQLPFTPTTVPDLELIAVRSEADEVFLRYRVRAG